MGWLIAWGWASVFAGLFIGGFIAYGTGDDL